jgi:hypothetical protein
MEWADSRSPLGCSCPHFLPVIVYDSVEEGFQNLRCLKETWNVTCSMAAVSGQALPCLSACVAVVAGVGATFILESVK